MKYSDPIDKLPTVRYGKRKVPVEVPKKNLLYYIGPRDLSPLKDVKKAILKSLKDPISNVPLIDQLEGKSEVVILADDITRPTPQKKIIPILLDELSNSGIKEEDVTIIIGLGTHRYMTREEILDRFGKQVIKQVKVINHAWDKGESFHDIGMKLNQVPVKINKSAYEADYLIGVGSIVPHAQAGWGGGGKIILPGVCSPECVGQFHLFAADLENFLYLTGDAENEARSMIELVAKQAGLKFIINVVFNSQGDLVKVVAGDPIKAHREGVEVAEKIYKREVPKLADIVITSCYPADIDYWQGVKPLTYAQYGVKEGGVVILVGAFPDEVSPTHKELEKFGTLSTPEIKQRLAEGKISDTTAGATLILHSLLTRKREVICVSSGLSVKQKESLGFEHAGGINAALDKAFKLSGKDAKVGIIDHGGDVLPEIG